VDSDTPPHTSRLISALLDYRSAEESMRARTGDSMRMGATDLQALRFLLKSQREGRTVSGRELADHLGMTSASVSVMLDRLTRSGHVQRSVDPANRRSNLVTATAGADEEVRATLGAMHRRMMDVAGALGEREAAIVRSFLLDMTDTVDAIDAADLPG
jgi:DNA-binding MarR family transcriptional regulator